jgi:hypothetical protein
MTVCFTLFDILVPLIVGLKDFWVVFSIIGYNIPKEYPECLPE